MTQDEFKAKCAEAIKQWHDPKEDGPLLVSTREMSSYSPKADDWEETFTEYAATIGHWPQGYLGESALEFDQFADDIIASLKKQAEELWHARQPEPEAEPVDEAKQAERKVYDDLLN